MGPGNLRITGTRRKSRAEHTSPVTSSGYTQTGHLDRTWKCCLGAVAREGHIRGQPEREGFALASLRPRPHDGPLAINPSICAVFMTYDFKLDNLTRKRRKVR